MISCVYINISSSLCEVIMMYLIIFSGDVATQPVLNRQSQKVQNDQSDLLWGH